MSSLNGREDDTRLIKLNRLNNELEKHQNANLDYMDTGIKILDVCKKVSMPCEKITPQMIAQIVRMTASSVTIKDKKVKMQFAEPYATLEKLIKLAKQGITESGYEEFFKSIMALKDTGNKALKKSLKGSSIANPNSVICTEWWAAVDSNHRPHPYQGCALTT